MRYKFCPKCAGKLVNKTNGMFVRPTCSRCGFIFYQNSKSGANAVIIKNDKVLLARRAIGPHQGFWSFLSGFLEDGEHPEDGVKREVQEESGFKIEIKKLLGVSTHQYKNEDTEKCHVINFFYLAQIIGGREKLDAENSHIKWFLLHKLPVKITPVTKTGLKLL